MNKSGKFTIHKTALEGKADRLEIQIGDLLKDLGEKEINSSTNIFHQELVRQADRLASRLLKTGKPRGHADQCILDWVQPIYEGKQLVGEVRMKDFQSDAHLNSIIGNLRELRGYVRAIAAGERKRILGKNRLKYDRRKRDPDINPVITELQRWIIEFDAQTIAKALIAGHQTSENPLTFVNVESTVEEMKSKYGLKKISVGTVSKIRNDPVCLKQTHMKVIQLIADHLNRPKQPK